MRFPRFATDVRDPRPAPGVDVAGFHYPGDDAYTACAVQVRPDIEGALKVRAQTATCAEEACKARALCVTFFSAALERWMRNVCSWACQQLCISLHL